MRDEIIDKDLPIIDAHHHLWDFGPVISSFAQDDHPLIELIRRAPRYLLNEFMEDTESGHNITATVYVECGAFYRADGPVSLRPIGEVEHANGVAACSASGLYGKMRACSGIVGHADLTLGDSVAPVLEAQIAAGNGRLRGIRVMGAQDNDARVVGSLVEAKPGLYLNEDFRRGFAHLRATKLSFDAWILEPQLDEITDLARAFPDIPIVLDHVGTPVGIARYQGTWNERFPIWRDKIRTLAKCPNVAVKLSGLAMPYCAFPGLGPHVRPTYAQLADLWRPYSETVIEAFTPSRAMFASNFPVDNWGADYRTIWNAFKQITRNAGDSEKRMLFAQSAARFYRLNAFV